MGLETQFVTYDIAKQLRDKGFDEPCMACYTLDIRNEHELQWNEPRHPTDFMGEMINYTLCGAISAPLWQQAIDWFETKGIFISIEYAAPDTNKFHWRVDNYNHVLFVVDFLSKEAQGKFCGDFGKYSKEWYSERIECIKNAISYALEILPK